MPKMVQWLQIKSPITIDKDLRNCMKIRKQGEI